LHLLWLLCFVLSSSKVKDAANRISSCNGEDEYEGKNDPVAVVFGFGSHDGFRSLFLGPVYLLLEVFKPLFLAQVIRRELFQWLSFPLISHGATAVDYRTAILVFMRSLMTGIQLVAVLGLISDFLQRQSEL
jgi:hypothetical protein